MLIAMKLILAILFFRRYYSQYTTVVQINLLLPPVLVTCSNSQHHVYQRHDNDFHISCFWDEKIGFRHSRNHRLTSEIEGKDLGRQFVPRCPWYQDSIWIKDTSSWSGQLVLNTNMDGGDAHPPWIFTYVIVQCISALCVEHTWSHINLTIEVAKQDVRLFLLSPQNLLICKWEPAELGWSACLMICPWIYHFKSQGDNSADFLIPITDWPIKAPYVLCLSHSLLQPASKGNRRNTWDISELIVRRQTTRLVHVEQMIQRCHDYNEVKWHHAADFLYLDSIQNQWKEGSCSLGPQTSWSKIHCTCETKANGTETRCQWPNYFDIKFLTGKYVLYPNPLDINKVLLAEFDTNPVTLFAVFSIFAIYIFGVTWAMIKDKAHLKAKNKIIVLPDIDPYQHVCYLVTMYTGSRLESGTTADVYLELIGQYGVSDVHHMKHPQFHTFSRASIDTFLLTTKYDLGKILSLHVWHNNSGSSPDWYLSRVKVHNLQTNQSWFFVCRNWLGLGKADGKIERSFAAKNLKSSLNKIDYFLISLARDLQESHMWFSIFSPTGSFTRVQRVSYCLVIMLTNMLFNIMFFSGEQELISGKQRYLKSIYVGFVKCLFLTPLWWTINVLFKYSEEKPSEQKTTKSGSRGDLPSLSEILMKEGTLSDAQTSNVKAQEVSFPYNNTNNNNGPGKVLSDTDQMAVHPKFLFFSKTPRFSWWWRYVSWGLVFLISGASAALIILYGLTYGYTTSMKWITASIKSFFKGVFFWPILKTVSISAMKTMPLKFCENLNWISREQYHQMKLDQHTLDSKEKGRIHDGLVRVRRTKEYAPLTEDEVIVFSIKGRAQHPPDVSKTKKLECTYMWMRNVFVPLIHNDYEPTYVSESWSKILGLPRVRQICAKNTQKTCFTSHSFVNNHVISTSHWCHTYNTGPEDESDYLGSWTKPLSAQLQIFPAIFKGLDISQTLINGIISLMMFSVHTDLEGILFISPPREQRLNTTLRLDDLQRNNWFDERRWAVNLELTFNPDVDLYCSIAVTFETTFSHVYQVYRMVISVLVFLLFSWVFS